MFVLYMLTFVLASISLAWLGHDSLTAISAVAATLGNVGPGLGTVGPTENYFHFSLTAKWVCILCMLIGRLEVYAVLVLLVPEFWRK
jgi:trk system potassium uptake protein TrkH